MVPPASPPFGNVRFGRDVDYDQGSVAIGANTWDDSSTSDRHGAVFLYEDKAIVTRGNFEGIFCDGFQG